ncbi:hypothetical protein FKM82_019923 [Ascaphus truei]
MWHMMTCPETLHSTSRSLPRATSQITEKSNSTTAPRLLFPGQLRVPCMACATVSTPGQEGLNPFSTIGLRNDRSPGMYQLCLCKKYFVSVGYKQRPLYTRGAPVTVAQVAL